MRLRSRVDQRPTPKPAHACPAIVDTNVGSGAVSRDGQRRQGSRRGSRNQLSPCCNGPTEEFAEPPDDLMLEMHRGMVSASHARVHGGSDSSGHRRQRVRWRVHPCRKARVAIAEGVGNDGGADLIPQRIFRSTAGWPRFSSPRIDSVSRRPPHDVISRAGDERFGNQTGCAACQPSYLVRFPLPSR